MIAVSRAGRRAARLILLGLPGEVVVLVLVATVTVVAVSRPPAAARGGDWVTSWGASPQHPVPGTTAAPRAACATVTWPMRSGEVPKAFVSLTRIRFPPALV